MSRMRHAAGFGLSFFTAAALMYLFFGYSHLVPGEIALVAIPLVAVCAGYLQGMVLGHQYYVSIGCGSFLALLAMWVPVVVVTYGFALMGVPVLVVLAGCAAWGAQLSKELARK
ncbi:hypothetical protein [Pseudoduganella sp. GCM10020061]|uniref:hypothetical protein n=1 Tax=Pseudoduganella sp. GCM10020061 TaxID=3317345 RepID=UPI00363EA249